MDSFDDIAFNAFLKKHGCVLVVKIHPVEQAHICNKIVGSDNVVLLSDQLLAEHGTDLYELLNGADILITDWSSVFFDFLLLDRPIIFVQTDVEVYREHRGFLLEPIDDWMPGIKVGDQMELETAIFQSLRNPRRYAEHRHRILSLVHHHADNRSSERVWDFIEQLIQIAGR